MARSTRNRKDADDARGDGVPLRLWGEVDVDFDAASLTQIERAARLPVAAWAALMPDAHVGYGLPIGGVLATRGAVIPYAVGVDIACRVRLTVTDLEPALLENDRGRRRLADAIERHTRFGVGASFSERREHGVMDRDWGVSPITAQMKDRAWSQLGTSGSGNHFVEFGVLTVPEGEGPSEIGLAPGGYLALLSHSGSRGAGAAVCNHYSKLATDAHPELAGEARHLAWLDLDSEPGREYWAAMSLMGEYASANHACIHGAVLAHLGAGTLATVENHHNFAWLETHDLGSGPERVVVHRKGATPAGRGALGVIPGSMASPGYVVRGRSGEGSLDSAAHGAGRVMSRSKARRSLRWDRFRDQLREAGVTVLSAGIDELPAVYKDIRTVMQRQRDLVDTVARFDPKIVKMAPDGERAED